MKIRDRLNPFIKVLQIELLVRRVQVVAAFTAKIDIPYFCKTKLAI
jgi:hypothetical protein